MTPRKAAKKSSPAKRAGTTKPAPGKSSSATLVAPDPAPPREPRPAQPMTAPTTLTTLRTLTARSVASLPEAAFDSLYTHSVSGLVRQVELLTGNPGFAWRAVRRAFDLAWQRWPEVAADPDPVGWVRATAYEYALAPWHQWVPGHRTRPRAAARASLGSERDRALREAVLRLPRAQRQAVVLYDGLGLDLPVAAAESEASTVTMAGRITRARGALSTAVPELGDQAPARLYDILSTDPTDPPDPEGAADPAATTDAKDSRNPRTAKDPAAPRELPAARMRDASERNVHRRTLAAVALTAVIAGAVGAALVVTYDRVGELPHDARPTQVTASPTAAPRQGVPKPVRPGHPAPAPARLP
ncbi:sigma factor-like helix-turn-helix DNA-binding protein [Streptomyces sp. H39-S7]|uniref:sigma factor-like helix-turn-helix DNA-binding protein n=1 Tax=Streptomyces sp. H39-S7 TaxID=3004357 RepID=UPI0022AF0F12|nr:sigma factor-like helix-turn-helix DNA-binding protein [Streptomyces sp. H39-S7]MCZ4120669.1 sigma factor-like helix-turn-helix DNA-binding protein [Streptomyces sp. H39-S7]